MPQNRIQFLHGMSLSAFLERFGTEAQCREALLQARSPDGFLCPRCGGREHSTFEVDGERLWQCSACRHQSTLCAGTHLHATKLSLTQWFQALYLVAQNKNDHAALSLMRHLGVCYRTAWRLKHKILQAMAERDAGRLLCGVGNRR